MNAAETVRLCQMIQALCPAQKFTDETPAVWAAVLEGVSLADALAALKQVATRQTFVAPADLIQETRRMRATRGNVEIPTPNVDPDDTLAYRAELLALTRAAADGTLDVQAYERGGRTLTGHTPLRALDAAAKKDPADLRRMIEAAQVKSA